MFCKQTLATAVACLTLGGTTLAHGETCSTASLKGACGQSIAGEILPAVGSSCRKTGSP